jgi:hypothetical protein
MADRIYTVQGSLTAGKAAPADILTLTAPANGRIKVVGLTIGSQAATAAAATAWQLLRLSADATGTAFTPTAVDPDDSASRATAKSTITANGTATGNPVWEFAFDAVASYTIWFPPNKEITVVNSGILALRKVVGSDTNVWSATLAFAE